MILVQRNIFVSTGAINAGPSVLGNNERIYARSYFLSMYLFIIMESSEKIEHFTEINLMYLLGSYRLSLLLAGCSFSFFTIMSSQETVPELRSFEAERSLTLTLALPVSQ